jgi:chromosomal replication initiator protein
VHFDLDPWELIKRKLQSILSAESFQSWLSNTAFSRLENGILYVLVPDEESRLWIETEYAGHIRQALKALPGVRDTVFEPRIGRGTPDSWREPVNFEHAQPLNGKFTFDSFVVGACNQFAHAAARSVASNPSKSYNPLFIYGGVGMGKTHLMHAIGRALIDNFTSQRIVYISSERFMNEMIASIRNNQMPQFQRRYRSADVLLVDDIQVIGGKERTQEEFFHTFNELHDNQRQIVISSDSPPKEIPGLLERLRSRFEWGLMADMQPPDLETKMAILDKKAETNGVKLPDEVRSLLATRTKSNVRELEGGLVKLIAYSELTGSPINVSMAQHVLRHLVHVQERKVTIDQTQKAVAERFGIKQAQLREKSNTKALVYPRQIAMYLVKELTSASLPEIGRSFGGKHHTTVLHSINKIGLQRQSDPELQRLLNKLVDSLQ